MAKCKIVFAVKLVNFCPKRRRYLVDQTKLPKWIDSKDVGKAKHAVLSNLLNWVQKLKTSEAEEVEVK